MLHYAARYPSEVSKLILSSTLSQFRLDDTVKMMRSSVETMQQRLLTNFSNPSQEAYDAYGEICLPLYSNPNASGAGNFRNRAIERPEVALHFFSDEMARMDMRARFLT
ncbi:MAG: hypothetical protein CM15mP54_28690 [Paracoccaceae bacterium]|nr:MAG: hypothetical protein CM15mP54_28690 [Paracoccaceae bacterium]